MKKVTAEAVIKMSEASNGFRRELSRQSFPHFFVYYFRPYITDPFAPFHYGFFEDLHDLVEGKILEAGWFTFRGSAKTSIAKAFLSWCICNKLYSYINVDSYDKANSERFLFDVVLELQTNSKLKDDYGDLYNATRSANEVTQKRVKDFLTNNKVRVEAHSTQEPVRGRLHMNQRPQLLIADDFEVIKTAKSEALTEQIGDHIAEARPGMDAKRRSILWLGNYLTESGNVQKIIDKAKHDEKVRVKVIPLFTGGVKPYFGENGQISPKYDDDVKLEWPERYALTDTEAAETGKASVEAEYRSLFKDDGGDRDFQREMLCNAKAGLGGVFHRDQFRRISLDDLRGHDFTSYLVVDSGGAADTDDMTDKDPAGFTACFVDKDGRWYLRSWELIGGPTKLIGEIFNALNWLDDLGVPCARFGWEKTLYTNALKTLVEAEMVKRKQFFAIEELKSGGRSKPDRIKGVLLPRYEQGRVFHIDGMCDDLETQLLRFPNLKHDDVADSAAYIADLINLAPSNYADDEETVRKNREARQQNSCRVTR